METVYLILGIIAAVIGTGGQLYETGFTEFTRNLSEPIQNRINRIINKLTVLVSEDNKLKEDLMNAFNQKNAKKLTALITNSPVGAAYHSLLKEIDNDETTYQQQIHDINERQKQYATLTNDANRIASSAATSAYNYGTSDSKSKDLEKQVDELSAAQQATQGGLKEGQ